MTEASSPESTVAAGDTPGRPARPAGYWERIKRIADTAPPLSAEQRALIRTAFHRPRNQEAA